MLIVCMPLMSISRSVTLIGIKLIYDIGQLHKLNIQTYRL